MNSDLFITFGGGRRGFQLAANRLAKEVAKSSWDADILVFDEKSAASHLGDDWNVHSNFFIQNNRGYGLWLWKSILLRNALRGRFGSYQRVLYLDAGSQFSLTNSLAEERFQYYLELTSKFSSLAFTHREGQFGIQDFAERRWGQHDFHAAIGMDESLLDLPQIQAGCLFLTPESLYLMDDWFNWCIKDSYKYLIGNTESDHFGSQAEHRFDQSVLSPLWRKYYQHTLPDETWFAPNWRNTAINYPIWTIRNDSSMKLPAKNFINKARHRTEIYYSLLFDRITKL